MADSNDVKTTLIDNLVDGVSEKQIGDKRYTYHSPAEVYEVMKQLAADEPASSVNGPFLKVRFK